MRWTVALGIVAFGACFQFHVARAEEQMVPLVVSGEWATLAHRPSMLAPPDTCLVVSARGFLIRADEMTLELRMINKSWSLPPDVHGTIKVSVGNWTKTLAVAHNTTNMLGALLMPYDILPMFEAMDKAASMTVTVGNVAPIIISLAGSTKATNAFRTCAGIKSNAKTPGSNPFD